MARSAAALAMASVPPTLSRNTACQPLGSIASAGAKYCPPALLTRTSSRPWRSSTSSTIRAASDSSRTSPGMAAQRSPIAFAAASSTWARRQTMATRAPQACSSAAVARPRPVPPPVTSATCSRSSPSAKMREAVAIGAAV